MKSRCGGWLDGRLQQRVEQYLTSSSSEYVDLSAMALELQKIYRIEYGRRNRTAFRIQVEKVYEAIMKESGQNHLESEHMAKRSTNHLNSSLTSLYRKGNPDLSMCSPWKDQRPKKSNSLIGLSDKEPGRIAKNCNFHTLLLNILQEVCKLLVHMRHPEVYKHLGMVPPRGFLLHGPPGCGKTLLAQAVAGELKLPMLKVSAPELVSGVSGESEQKLRELFDSAVSSAPCILFIDEIDAITPRREVASKDMERRIVAQLLTCMDDLNSVTVTAQVLVIGATNRPDSLDPALRRAGRFDREICLGIPDEAARLRILKTLCRKLKLPNDFDYQHLAHLTPGYVGADLMALCREAVMNAVNRILHGELCQLLHDLRNPQTVSEEELSTLSILMLDFQASLASIQPSAKREGFATVPDVTWENVGALQDIREELTMVTISPMSNLQFRALGLSAPSGVLLAGPPGCGKTLLAKAVANESGLNFISIKGPELLNMYVGESERAVRQVFQRGRNSAPCVIFFDEIDALCPRRSGFESGASVRVVNQLLTEMDGLETRRQVFIMAATNRPDIIDPAILRPGRLDKTLYVGLPPPADRHAILLTITKGGTKPSLEQNVSLEEIAFDERCDCFTGADLSALVREASINALRAYLKSENSPGIRVSKQNFEDAFKKVRPSVSKKEQKTYEQLKESLGR
uniref:AAA+ ATPase domain-containing protein n=1 Tax=Echeneis naucrates TaxID=173247 RepID=A0A665U084_ECHNA